jgi:predicted ATP-binding protein involved in virulence
MANNIIKSFTINGLFGTTNLTIPFEGKAKILIGENGLGKTQVLNMLYYTLTKRFHKLMSYEFQSIDLIFHSDEKVSFKKEDISDKLLSNSRINSKILRQTGGIENLMKMKGFFEEEKPSFRDFHGYAKYLLGGNRFSPIYIKEIYELLLDSKETLFNSLYEQTNSAIDNVICDYRVLYFPTYRRVEEDLKNLGYDEEQFDINRNDSRLINFGMDDVKGKFKELTHQIEKLSKDGLSKISSEILSQLVKGLPNIDRKFLSTIKEKDIDIILARVGNQITKDDKIRIKYIVRTKSIKEDDKSLLYFLKKLIDIYDQQRDLDEMIKRFRDICNKYLVNKKLVYDESKIEIFIKVDNSTEGSSLDLSDLSSGEKQIISIFSKVYLSKPEEKYIVLFDEPELSLSIFWQENLLPDIIDSGKCEFLFAVTHSPFIFNNKLDKYATSLNEYFSPITPELVG